MGYNFSALSDRDLEVLVRDLLSAEFNIRFQSFKPGKDGGIDLRYAATDEKDEIIVQVKHYIGSSFSMLKNSLKKNELSKIKTISPKRYIFVTSLPLSLINKNELKTLLSPFVLSVADIIGQEDLNQLLAKYKEIESMHFKLWLTSTNVLNRIVNNGIKGRSTFNKERIEQKIKLFVTSSSHEQAVKKLNDNNFLLITGAPGIGKSTLADILTYQLLEHGYELIFTPDIQEAEELFLKGKKQVFYMDDFLGSITLELKSSNNADSAISAFLQRVKSDKDKRLILTCRTAIFNQAKEASEKLSNSKIDLSRHEVELDGYSDYHKARILYNHIYWSKLPEEFKLCFTQDRFYRKIIHHPNYNPRIIEFFTDIDMISQDNDFKENVLNFLDHPDKLWKHAFNKQISYEGRIFIITLFSFGKSAVNIDHLKLAFNARIQYEVRKHLSKKEPNIFNKTVRELDGAYIQSVRRNTQFGHYIEFSLTNPSLIDYLVDYFNNEDLEEYFETLEAAIFTDQFRERISTKTNMKKRIVFDKKEKERLQNLVNSKIGNFSSINGDPYWQEVLVLINLFGWNSIRELVLSRCNNFDKSHLSWSDYTVIINLLSYITENSLLKQFDFLTKKYIYLLANNLHSHWQLEELTTLLRPNDKLKEVIVNILHSDQKYYEDVQSKIDAAWEAHLPDYIEQFGFLTNVEYQEDTKEQFHGALSQAQELNELLEIPFSPIFSFHDSIFKGISKKNKLRLKSKTDKIFSSSSNLSDENPEAIDLLFNVLPESLCPF